MAWSSSLRKLLSLLVTVSLLSTLCAADAVSDLQTKGRTQVNAQLAKSTTCTKDKLQVRKEWYEPFSTISRTHLTRPCRGDISATDKKAYIAAVLCEPRQRIQRNLIADHPSRYHKGTGETYSNVSRGEDTL